MKYLLILLLIFSTDKIYSQCNGSSQSPLNSLNAPNWGTDTLFSALYAGEYSLVEDFADAQSYIFTTDSLHEDYITLTTEPSSSDPGYVVLAFGVPPLSYTTIGEEEIYVHINLAVGCGSENSIRGAKITCSTCTEPSNVGIGTNEPASSAILDISATNQGIRIPSMVSTQRDNIGDPVDGLLIYNKNSDRLESFNGVQWYQYGDEHTWTDNNDGTATLGNITVNGGFSSTILFTIANNPGLAVNAFGMWHSQNGTNKVGFEIGDNDAWEPYANNDLSLGTSSYKWSEVWATNGTIQTSDSRLKSNIKSIDKGLIKINMLNPVSYSWTSDNNKAVHIGFLAQELEKVLPEVVVHSINTADEIAKAAEGGREMSADNYGVKYAEIIPVLVKGVQELSALVDEQNRSILQLEEKLKTQENQIFKMKSDFSRDHKK